MILSDNYLIDNIGGTPVAIPIGQNIVDLSKAIELKGAAIYICECLKKELSLQELREQLYEHFEASESDKAIIDQDLNNFISDATIKKLIV